MKLEAKATERLITKLKAMQRELKDEQNSIIKDLEADANQEYTNKIDELVYDQYTPEKYERTLHLRGAHGAIQQEIVLSGSNKRYTFRIDGNSRDPVDGETWNEKANKIEHGANEMSVGFNRPFVSETQRALEFRNKQAKDALIRKMQSIVRRSLK